MIDIRDDSRTLTLLVASGSYNSNDGPLTSQGDTTTSIVTAKPTINRVKAKRPLTQNDQDNGKGINSGKFFSSRYFQTFFFCIS